MSRIGKNPIQIPQGVTVTIADSTASVTGPKGNLSMKIHRLIEVEQKDGQLIVKPAVGKEEAKGVGALWGTTRANLSNLIEGVTKGFEKRLEMQGVGYRAEIKGKNLVLYVGLSHPVDIVAPEGITFAVEKNVIVISGIDKQAVGEISAQIRRVRPPEPYKGKGIRYLGEMVRRKVGKVVGGTEG